MSTWMILIDCKVNIGNILNLLNRVSHNFETEEKLIKVNNS